MTLDPKAGINEAQMPQALLDLISVVDPATQEEFARYISQYIAAQKVLTANGLVQAALNGQPLNPVQVALWNLLCAAQSAGH